MPTIVLSYRRHVFFRWSLCWTIDARSAFAREIVAAFRKSPEILLACGVGGIESVAFCAHQPLRLVMLLTRDARLHTFVSLKVSLRLNIVERRCFHLRASICCRSADSRSHQPPSLILCRQATICETSIAAINAQGSIPRCRLIRRGRRPVQATTLPCEKETSRHAPPKRAASMKTLRLRSPPSRSESVRCRGDGFQDGKKLVGAVCGFSRSRRRRGRSWAGFHPMGSA